MSPTDRVVAVAALRRCLDLVAKDAVRVRDDIAKARPLEVITVRALHEEGRALARLYAEIEQLIPAVERGAMGWTSLLLRVGAALAREVPGAESQRLREAVRSHVVQAT